MSSAKNDDITSLSQEISETRQQISALYERMAEIKDRVIKLEQKNNKNRSQAASFSDAVRMPNPNPNLSQIPSSAKRLETRGYAASEEERKWQLIQVKVTHPAISNTSLDLETCVRQFLLQQFNM